MAKRSLDETRRVTFAIFVFWEALVVIPTYFILGWGGAVFVALFALACWFLGWRTYRWFVNRYPGF